MNNFYTVRQYLILEIRTLQRRNKLQIKTTYVL